MKYVTLWDVEAKRGHNVSYVSFFGILHHTDNTDAVYQMEDGRYALIEINGAVPLDHITKFVYNFVIKKRGVLICQ
jgi:hypothetical protein